MDINAASDATSGRRHQRSRAHHHLELVGPSQHVSEVDVIVDARDRDWGTRVAEDRPSSDAQPSAGLPERGSWAPMVGVLVALELLVIGLIGLRTVTLGS